MKTFENQATQGELLFIRVKSIPKDAEEVKPVDGMLVAGHSETGHHHAFDSSANPSVWLYSTKDELVSYLKVDRPAPLKHFRDFDTHEPIEFKKGVYKIIHQREITPQGWRRVED